MPFSLALLAEKFMPRLKNIMLFSSGGGAKSESLVPVGAPSPSVRSLQGKGGCISD